MLRVAQTSADHTLAQRPCSASRRGRGDEAEQVPTEVISGYRRLVAELAVKLKTVHSVPTCAAAVLPCLPWAADGPGCWWRDTDPGWSSWGCSALCSTSVNPGKTHKGALLRQKLFLEALFLLSTGSFMFSDPNKTGVCGESLSKISPLLDSLWKTSCSVLLVRVSCSPSHMWKEKSLSKSRMSWNTGLNSGDMSWSPIQTVSRQLKFCSKWWKHKVQKFQGFFLNSFSNSL